MSHVILSELNEWWFVLLGLFVWAGAYAFLTYVITPDSIGDLMTLIVAVLPFFILVIAGWVAFVSFVFTPRHFFQGSVFAIFALVAGVVTRVNYRKSEIKKALGKTIRRSLRDRSLWPTLWLICWGSLGAILVFASEFGLIFGGWLLIQGSTLWGGAWAGVAAIIAILGWRPDSVAKNPIRRCVVALKGEDPDLSGQFIKRLLQVSGRLRNTSEPAVRA